MFIFLPVLKQSQLTAKIKAVVGVAVMSLVVPDAIVQASGLNEDELLMEIVILLYQQNKISLGKASELLGVSQLKLQRSLSDRGICIHYDVEEFQQDLEHLRKKGWL